MNVNVFIYIYIKTTIWFWIIFSLSRVQHNSCCFLEDWGHRLRVPNMDWIWPALLIHDHFHVYLAESLVKFRCTAEDWVRREMQRSSGWTGNGSGGSLTEWLPFPVQVFLWPFLPCSPSHSCHSPSKTGGHFTSSKNRSIPYTQCIEGMFGNPGPSGFCYATQLKRDTLPIIKRLNYGRLNLLKAWKWIKIPVDPREYTWSISTIYQQSSLQVEDMFCDENDVPSYLKQLKRRSHLTFTMDHISPPRLFQRHASQSRRAARMTVLSHGHDRIMDFGDLGAKCRPGIHTVDISIEPDDQSNLQQLWMLPDVSWIRP